jgi:hypothetical protein
MNKNIDIVKAHYGMGGTFIDVVDVIKGVADKSSVHVCNELFGKDPCYGVRKYLIVEWRDGFRYTYPYRP